VGAGQSSFSVNDITDVTILLITPGGGDELQGIKRGSTELADLIVVNKDDSGMEAQAKNTQTQYQQAMRLYRIKKLMS
jgi:LAO/AO transport system kinase